VLFCPVRRGGTTGDADRRRPCAPARRAPHYGPDGQRAEAGFEKHSYRAGTHRVALQVCDDAIPQANLYDQATCRANARQYVANATVIRLRGAGDPDSQPSTRRAGRHRQPVEHVCRSDEAAAAGSEGLARQLPPHRPAQLRACNPADDVQAAADALAARSLGVQRVYVLYPREYEVPPGPVTIWVYGLDTKALGLVSGNCYRIDVSVNATKITNAFAVFQPTK
jgi:hypothetical protein